MISGDRSLAEGKHGAFYSTLEEFHKYWDRIDIICPRVKRQKVKEIFGNVFVHPSLWQLILQPFWIFSEGLRILKTNGYSLMANNYLMTVHEFPPFYNGIGARLLWQKIGVPYILEIHHIPGYPKAAGLKERIYRELVSLFIKWDSAKAKAIRVVNQGQTPEFLVKSGVPREKIVYIPSMYIDSDVFKPLDLEKKYDLIFVGRLERNKGIELFIDGAKILNAKALIVGSGSLSEEIKYKIQNTKYDIHLHGWARDSQEIAELINKSKILVMPSYNEGGPRVVLEAMACGVPVLATPVGIVPDIVKDGESGEITTWNSYNIAEKAKKLLNDPVRYEKYSRAGIELAKQFEKKAAIKNYADKLRGLI